MIRSGGGSNNPPMPTLSIGTLVGLRRSASANWSKNLGWSEVYCSTAVASTRLEVSPWLVAIDVGQTHIHQHGADVLMFELDGAAGSLVELWGKSLAVLRLVVGYSQKLSLKHLKIIRDDQPDFGFTPVIAHLANVIRLVFN